jgi:hypothetical protein
MKAIFKFSADEATTMKVEKFIKNKRVGSSSSNFAKTHFVPAGFLA